MHLDETSDDITDCSRLLMAVGDACVGAPLVCHSEEPVIVRYEHPTGFGSECEHIGVRPGAQPSLGGRQYIDSAGLKTSGDCVGHMLVEQKAKLSQRACALIF